MTLNIIRITAILLLLIAGMLGILAVFDAISTDQLKDALVKTLAVGGIIIVIAAGISLASSKK